VRFFLLVALLVTVSGCAPAVRATEADQLVVPVAPPPAAAGVANTARCTDPTGTWMGMRWQTPVQWHVNTDTVPAYLGGKAAVVRTLRAAADNVMDTHNDCGLPGDLAMREIYAGATPRHAGVSADGGCGNQDGQNTVSFGTLKAGLLAVTCVWWVGPNGTGRSVEADILIDDSAGLFYVGDTPAGCDGRWDLQGTLTHEFGHVFGLGHVPYAQHSQLTMSDGLPDCSSAYRGLGLGDYLMLKREYGH